jgi:hypothetical protein
MNDTIFHLNENGQLIEMNESGYLTEDLLQKLLADYPNLLSGSQINPDRPRRWMLVSRELGVHDSEMVNNRWSLDHLFLDQDGIPTLVEVKRSTDTRIRREVIGQILDYAANGVSYWSPEEIRLKFENQCQASGIEASEVLRELLNDEQEEDKFWDTVKTNLQAGKIRMLIVADIIPKELQRVIEFLNGQMSPAEILGVEIKQFLGQSASVKTLVPRVVGLTSNAQTIKSTNRGSIEHWTEETFIEKYFKVHGEAETELIKKLLAYLRPKISSFWYGKGSEHGSIFPMIYKKHRHYPFALWTYGTIEMQFQHMKPFPPFDNLELRKEFMTRLNTIPGIAIPEDKLDKRPSFPVKCLMEPKAMEVFWGIMEWYFGQLEGY